MRYISLAIIIALPLGLLAQPSAKQITAWKKQAKNVTIIRDQWGVPHIYGKKDADCVFGLMYAQCEDDFYRVESNYIDVLGRRAETEGEKVVYQDLYKKLVYDDQAAREDYKNAPAWLKELLNAWADGMNYYLYKNPSVKPVLINHFEPWFPLMWTDGSIGSINTAGFTYRHVEAFYTKQQAVAYHEPAIPADERHNGSNGFAFSPSKTSTGNAILYINPHTTFYFRPEVHMVSEQGLNAYGAVTWGQFFVYQGFNEFCGWMHTSGYTDVADAYIENVKFENGQYWYLYENSWKPVQVKKIDVKYKNGAQTATKTVEVYATHHGPVMALQNDRWITVKANNRDMNGLIQSWQRTKANSFEDFKKMMDIRANTSNNTVYADRDGNIAYWHGNFVPKRDTSYNWNLPVDGTTSSTEWKGLHEVEETIHMINPSNGWLQNCNSTPFTMAGTNSPRKEDYPSYMSTESENYRGINAVRILSQINKVDLDSVIALGYNTYLPVFEYVVPGLIRHFKALGTQQPDYRKLKEVIDTLYEWDYASAENSIATLVAIEYAQQLQGALSILKGNLMERFAAYGNEFPAERSVEILRNVIDQIEKRNGSWKTTWGTVNRFQRISGSVENLYDDSKESYPVRFAAGTWGSLPSFVSRYPDNKSVKRYGYSGNSFVCAVEFGEKVKAKSVLSGGVSADPANPHFNDQGKLFADGKFKTINFYKEDILKNAEKTYQPGL